MAGRPPSMSSAVTISPDSRGSNAGGGGPAPAELSNRRVLLRFALRIAIFGCFGAAGKAGFGQTFAQLLTIGTCYCVVTGGLKGEQLLDSVLTHYDEAAAYGLLAGLSWRFL